MTKKINIHKKTLENLYINKELSTYQISKKFNCDPTVIQNRLKENNITLRSPKKRIDMSKNDLKKLYWDKNLSSYKIAKLLKIGRTTIYNKLVDYGIGTRPKKIVRISKKKLKELYIDKRFSLSKIAELYNCSSSIILDKLKKYKIKRRDKYDANTIFIKKKFTGNKELKAYMIGFRLGDLHVKKDSQDSSILKITSNTTKIDQVNLIRNIYGIYGHFWIKKYGDIYSIGIQMDKSFGFLIPKEDNIPIWILKNKEYFFAFLGGYTDAEGNINLSQNRARFRIRTYDKNIISQIYNKLNFFGINSRFGLVSKRGFYGKRKQNKDCFGVFVNSKEDLFKLFKFIKPHLKHKKRHDDLIMAETNISERNKKQNINFKL